MKPRKAYLNILKMRLNIWRKAVVATNYPVVAYIDMTVACNLRCPACPTGLQLQLRPTATIDEGLFRAAIDQVGDYLFELYVYNWGEPLLHKRTPEMIAYASRKNIKTILSTNFSIRLSDDYLERLVRSGLDTLVVSIDGVSEEVYAKYRIKGNFSLVRQNLERISRIRDNIGSHTPRVIWQFLVFRHNEHEVEQAVASYRSWGADQINVLPAIMPEELYNEGFEPSTLPQYNQYRQDHPIKKENDRQLKADAGCSWLYGVWVLNPNGKVSPCCAATSEQNDFAEYTPQSGFFRAWNSDRFRRARELFAAPSARPALDRTEVAQRLNGMAAGLAGEDMICTKCPIPYLQNYVDRIVNDVSQDLKAAYRQSRSWRDKLAFLSNYVLMGGSPRA